MTLLNSMLALGALAFTVPLAIHLLFRSRHRTVDWGAMYLLNRVVRINRRRLQLLQILLLLLRCLLPVLLAFTLARPLLTGWRSLPGDAPQSLVLVIDDSRSMAAGIESGGSRLDQAKRLAVDLLSEYGSSDEIFLVSTSEIDLPPERIGHQEALRQLNRIQPDAAATLFDQVMQDAIRTLEQASYPNQRVVVLSDFQSTNFNAAAAGNMQSLALRLANSAARPAISWLDVTGGRQPPPNLSVESIAVESPSVVAGRQSTYEAIVRNDGDRPAADVRLVWSIDGVALRPVKMSLEPRATGTTRLHQEFNNAGAHRVSLRLQQSDALIEDNQRTIGLRVIEQVEVLLVDGQPRRQKLQSETDFLAVALSPFAFGGEQQPDAVRAKTIPARDLSSALNTESPDVVVLANVKSLDRAARDQLAAFLDSGGSLVVFDGDRVDHEAYNQSWGESKPWRLPAKLGLIKGNPDAEFSADQAIGETDLFEIAAFDRDYSPWQVLGGPDDQPFADVDVFAYRKLELESEESSDSLPAASQREMEGKLARVLLRFSNGDPLAVMARRGAGRVVQFAIPCDADWSNLPIQRVYLPMMQQLILDLAGSSKDLTVGVDQLVRVEGNELARLLQGATQAEQSDPQLMLRCPDGSERAVSVSRKDPVQSTGERFATFVTDAGPGLYRLALPSENAVEEDKQVSAPVVRVAQIPESESRLQSIGDDRLQSLAVSMGAEIYTDLPSLQQDDQIRRFGREIWRWLLVLLLAAMIAELFVQQRQARAAVAGVA